MPQVKVVFYMEDDGTIPFIDWLDTLPPRAQAKCVARLKRLEDLGRELRRPEADYLQEGMYELRVAFHGINYRILYFFHGRTTVVVSHGLVKERRVPPKEIDKAIERKEEFERDIAAHTFKPGN